MQEYFTSFAKTSGPNTGMLPLFPTYGSDFTDLNLNQTSIDLVQDPAANARCDWWQTVAYAQIREEDELAHDHVRIGL